MIFVQSSFSIIIHHLHYSNTWVGTGSQDITVADLYILGMQQDTVQYSTTSEELKRKRQALGVPHTARALVLCDAAAVHSCGMYNQLRQRFEHESNSVLLHGGPSSRISIPGGWGACGAPNDAWHGYWHYMRRGWMRAGVGMSASLPLRRALQDIDLAVDGNSRISLLVFLYQRLHYG